MSKRKATNGSGAHDVDFVSLLWPRLMSLPTAARYLDCTPWHMEELCRSGTILGVKEAGRWTIDRIELDRYVDRRVAETTDSKIASGPAYGADSNPYKTIKEAAEYLRTTPWFVAQKIRAGELPYIRAGKRHVIAVTDLNELYERMRRD